MRIVIDIQGAQGISRTRGIGRASLALLHALARHAGTHELWLLANSALITDPEDFASTFGGIVPPDRVRIFDVPGAVSEFTPANSWRTRAGELAREDVLRDLRPDATLITSLFEGLHDNAVTSIGLLGDGHRTAAVLYDLIPLAYSEVYLSDATTRRWYFRKLEALRNAGMLLSISEHSSREVITRVGIAEHRVRTMPLAADSRFRPVASAPEAAHAMRRRLGIDRPFIMYTGGIDHRKNIERLIEAFAMLSARTDNRYQLAVVCGCSSGDRQRLELLARTLGLPEKQFVLTGYVSDDDLVALYNLAALFAFPSLAEGFGLPVLEAMACGAPVVVSNSTSLPELVGCDDALFDPLSAASIAGKLEQVLADDDMRRGLGRHGLRRSADFSWDTSGKIALEALERMAHSADGPARIATVGATRPRLAFVSPLPPDRSGIASYSAELLRELVAHYDIELVRDGSAGSAEERGNLPTRSVSWFRANAARYDRILYQFGNSEFHWHMFDLLAQHPGTIVLHDFFLSDMIASGAHERRLSSDAFERALYWSHGYAALAMYHDKGEAAAVGHYPANREILDWAQGVVVHSHYALEQADRWYGEEFRADWSLIPPLRHEKGDRNRIEARERLGLKAGDFVVCSFGHLVSSKMADRVLSAWLASRLANRPDCALVFVGAGDTGPYFRDLSAAIQASAARARVTVTGYVSGQAYDDWLAAADVAVQLRTRSRGETSWAILDVLACGCPLIFNAHGSASELPETAGVKLADNFDDADLVAALEECHTRSDLPAVGNAGREYVRRIHAPASIGSLFHEAIERFASEHRIARQRGLIEAIADITSDVTPDRGELLSVARVLGRNHPAPLRSLFVALPSEERLDPSMEDRIAERLRGAIESAPSWVQVKPIHARGKELWSAHCVAGRLLKFKRAIVDDELIELRAGDAVVCLTDSADGNWADMLRDLRLRGISVRFLDAASVPS